MYKTSRMILLIRRGWGRTAASTQSNGKLLKKNYEKQKQQKKQWKGKMKIRKLMWKVFINFQQSSKAESWVWEKSSLLRRDLWWVGWWWWRGRDEVKNKRLKNWKVLKLLCAPMSFHWKLLSCLLIHFESLLLIKNCKND